MKIHWKCLGCAILQVILIIGIPAAIVGGCSVAYCAITPAHVHFWIVRNAVPTILGLALIICLVALIYDAYEKCIKKDQP